MVDQLQLASFGFSGSLSAIIHRTVRCSTGLSGVPSGVTATVPTVVCKSNSEQCATTRAESEQAPEGAPDSEQDLSGAPPDCPMTPLVRAPTVEPQRLGDVAGASDCPVRPSTEAFPNNHFGGWGYKYPPQPPHFKASKFSTNTFNTRASAFNTRHN
jgi:hypothetical protein